MATVKTINIVGCGIVGLITAAIIKKSLPDYLINIYEADSHPKDPSEQVGTTFGKGRDARHFSGTESTPFQNPVYARALRLAPGEHKDWAGWRLIEENKLTKDELRWRRECVQRFVDIGHERLNDYDDLHTQINYAGIAVWGILEKQFPFIKKHKLSEGLIPLVVMSETSFDADLKNQQNFLKIFGAKGKKVSSGSMKKYLNQFSKLVKEGKFYKNTTLVPGSSWRIKSLGLGIISYLEKEGVVFHWKKEITKSKQLKGDVTIWTVGTTHTIPDIYKKYSLIQGVAGCWVSIPNNGFSKPFKISFPQPIGQANCTPDGEILHVSAGFGWVGGRPYHEAVKLMEPVIEIFKQKVNLCFGTNMKDMSVKGRYPIGICIRPASPTGLPDVRTITINNQKNIILTGSAKSGATQSSMLALYALNAISPKAVKQFSSTSHIKDALSSLNSLYKANKFGKLTKYPEVLERDLFALK
ncbi:MAG TPA: hypothetical protein VLG67_05165 [Candidatus Saccharimonadales bacterium]|nr:hypothetical protein [Candidatus Saccharimonadales bacterium]